MNAFSSLRIAAASLCLLGFSANASTISINFVDDAAVDAMLPGDVAGVQGLDTRVANWNNVQAAASGAGGGFLYSDGTLSGASLTFTTDLNRWRLGHTDLSTGDDRMWKGYLDAAGVGSSVTVSGLDFVGAYDVYVYFDGANGGSWRVADFSIGAVTDGGEDSENTNWGTGQNVDKLYQQPVPGGSGNQPFGTVAMNNDEGNFIVLSGITGSEFTLTAVGGANAGGATFRAPINGFQIVGVIPEPSSAGLLLFGATALLGLRRRAR